MTDESEMLEEFISSKLEEIIQFRQSLTVETDRGCALMAAAYLDAAIEKLLSKHLVPNENIKREILGQSKPLGTFSSRIDMTYLLGLIGPKAHQDLHLIRKVRNDFGHIPTPITFNDQSLASRCREFYHDGYDKDVAPRDKFCRVVMGVLAIIHGNTLIVSTLNEQEDDALEDAEKSVEELTKTLLDDN